MARQLPYTPADPPQFRVLHAPRWGDGFQPLPMWDETKVGFEVLSFSRRAIPDFGRAVLRLRYGWISGRLYSIGSSGALRVPDLIGHEIVIEYDSGGGVWKTVWWGECLAMPDYPVPGSDVPAGYVECHCIDGLYRLTRQYLDRHQPYDSGGGAAEGHPGYNVASVMAPSLGNKEPTDADPNGLGYIAHTWPTVALTSTDRDNLQWTDQQVIEHALASSKPEYGGVDFTLHGSTDALQRADAWPVRPDMTAWELTKKVLDRRRIAVCAFLDWPDTSGKPSPRITLRPILADNLDNVQGATAAGTTVEVDLIGDQRLSDGGFQAVAETDTLYDSLETIGDEIQTVVTLSPADSSLEIRWEDDEQTTYEGLSFAERQADSPQFAHVFRAVGITDGWQFQPGDGTGDTNSRCDYAIDDDGQIELPDVRASYLTARIQDDLPMFAGYDYTGGTVAKFEGDPLLEPEPLPVQVWRRKDSMSDLWIDSADIDKVQVARAGNRGQDVSLRDGEDGGRYLEGLDDIEHLALTVSLTYGRKLRRKSYREGVAKGADVRAKRLRLPGLSLHLLHPLAIFGLDTDTGESSGYGPERGGLGGSGTTPGILRDDRETLAIVHETASAWYLQARKTVTWRLRAVGIYGSDEDDVVGSVPWPQMGQLITTMQYGGRTESMNTPITHISYDNRTRETTWVTSWADRDWRR